MVSKWRQLDSTAFPSSVGHGPLLRGLLSVRPGEPFVDSCTAGWAEETHFVREAFLEGACDAVQVHIDAAYYFPVWEPMPRIDKRERAEHRANPSRSVGVAVNPRFSAGFSKIASWSLAGETIDAAMHLVSTLSLHGATDSAEDKVVNLESVLGPETFQRGKSLPVLFIPPVIGQLIFANQWRHLAVKASWATQHFTAWFAHLPEAWLQDRAGERENDIPLAALTKASAEACVEQLREASGLLQARGILQDDMRAAFNKCAAALTSHCRSMCPSQKSLQHAKALTESFIQQILAAMDLRNRGLLRRHAKRFLLCFPEAVRPSMQRWADKVFASRSKLNRGQLYLDIAMLVFQHRRLSKLGPLYRYAWGDASTKRPLEIYNLRYRFLPQCHAVSLARAWKWLCLHTPESSVVKLVTLSSSPSHVFRLQSRKLMSSGYFK